MPFLPPNQQRQSTEGLNTFQKIFLNVKNVRIKNEENVFTPMKWDAATVQHNGHQFRHVIGGMASTLNCGTAV